MSLMNAKSKKFEAFIRKIEGIYLAIEALFYPYNRKN